MAPNNKWAFITPTNFLFISAFSLHSFGSSIDKMLKKRVYFTYIQKCQEFMFMSQVFFYTFLYLYSVFLYFDSIFLNYISRIFTSVLNLF